MARGIHGAAGDRPTHRRNSGVYFQPQHRERIRLPRGALPGNSLPCGRYRDDTPDQRKDHCMMLDHKEIAALTQEYGGDWGVQHSERLLHLISLIDEGLEYNSEAVWL